MTRPIVRTGALWLTLLLFGIGAAVGPRDVWFAVAMAVICTMLGVLAVAE